MPEPGPVQVQLVISFSLREGLGSCRHYDGVPDLAPEMSPVQNAGRLREVAPLFLLNPIGPICDDHHRTRGVVTERLRRGFGLLPKLVRGAKGGHVAPLDQAMPLARWLSGTSPLAPGKG